MKTYLRRNLRTHTTRSSEVAPVVCEVGVDTDGERLRGRNGERKGKLKFESVKNT